MNKIITPATFDASSLVLKGGERKLNGKVFPHAKPHLMVGEKTRPFKLMFDHPVVISRHWKQDDAEKKNNFYSVAIRFPTKVVVRGVEYAIPEAEETVRFLKEDFAPALWEKIVLNPSILGLSKVNKDGLSDFVNKLVYYDDQGTPFIYGSISSSNIIKDGVDQGFGCYDLKTASGKPMSFAMTKTHIMLGIVTSLAFEISVNKKNIGWHGGASLYGLVVSNLEEDRNKGSMLAEQKAQEIAEDDLDDIVTQMESTMISDLGTSDLSSALPSDFGSTMSVDAAALAAQ